MELKVFDSISIVQTCEGESAGQNSISSAQFILDTLAGHLTRARREQHEAIRQLLQEILGAVKEKS